MTAARQLAKHVETRHDGWFNCDYLLHGPDLELIYEELPDLSPND